MIADCKPYPAMKDSGVTWLGEVPAHWSVQPSRHLGRLFKGNGGNKADEVSSGVPCVRYGDLYTRHEFFIRKTKACITPEQAAGYSAIRYGDVLFAASGETIEDIGRSAVNLIESGARCGGDVLVLRPSVEVVPEFLGYAADSPPSRHQKSCMGRGFTVVHIYGSQLKRLALPLPPLPEQVAIVRFLDYADRRIRRYIRAKQKLIKLLEEQKQAIIHRAVTRGLDPNVRLKPSGVAWLGDVPEHWDVVALRHRYSQVLGKMLDSKRITGSHSLPYFRNTDVQWDKINVDDLPMMDIPESEYERYTVRIGDLLVCEGGEVGRCATWAGALAVCGFQKALHRLRPRNAGRDTPRFMYYALRSAAKTEAFNDGHVSTIPHLTGDKLRAHRFPFPSRSEQEAIVEFLDSALADVTRTFGVAQTETSLLREYRTRLIADLVTGKLDVREAAARLPDEPDEPEPAEEAEAPLDAEVSQAEDLDAIPEEAEA